MTDSAEQWAREEAERRTRADMSNSEKAFYILGATQVAVARDEYLAERLLSDEACPTCGRIEAAPNRQR